MTYKNRFSKDPMQSTLNDLKLFEQNTYCYEYLKKNFFDLDEDKLKYNSEIAASAFRQASEYYIASLHVSLKTSPLLYSYAMNNLLKGVCHLVSFDEELLNGFRNHGFCVKKENLSDNFIDSLVTVTEKFGAVQSLLKLYGDSLIPQDISLYKIIRHIPNLGKFYYESVGSISLVGKKDRNESDDFVFYGSNIDEESKDIINNFSLILHHSFFEQYYYGYLTLTAKSNIENKFYNELNLYYKDYICLPDYFKNEFKALNISFYSYLLIMSYGMMVRYNSNSWEKYIDKKSSKYGVLIELSIVNAINSFYSQMHYLLFDYYYVEETFNENDIKRIIQNSTKDIMNNITKIIENSNITNNRSDPLPWKKEIK